MGNQNLTKARAAKNDEFYTRLWDIEQELKYYKEFFRGKRVYCPCDDANWSNFWKYFAMNFEHLGLKSLDATCFHEGQHGEHWHYEGGYCDYEIFEDEGGFQNRNDILAKTDIVVTNPPFSLFREFVNWIDDRDYVIIGPETAQTYKESLPRIVSGRMGLGYTHVKEFDKPDGGVKNFGNICWYTSLDIPKRHIKLEFYSRYNEQEYPHYDNYDAINVSKVNKIPCDYTGIMGVPITFLGKFCPEQFEILGTTRYHDGNDSANDINYINGKLSFQRYLIRWKPEAMPRINEKGVIIYGKSKLN